MKPPVHIDDIIQMLLTMFPDMEVGEDLDGQLVVYTNWWCISSDEYYGPMDKE